MEKRPMQWWITKKDSIDGPNAPAPDLGTLGLLWPNCELPQSYLECPGGRCEGERAAARADAIEAFQSELRSTRAKPPQLRRDD